MLIVVMVKQVRWRRYSTVMATLWRRYSSPISYLLTPLEKIKAGLRPARMWISLWITP